MKKRENLYVLKRYFAIVMCAIMVFGLSACSLITDTISGNCHHQWSNATCTSPAKCNICGLTDGTALNHDWRLPTCDTPKTCQNCGDTMGRIETYSNGTYGSWSAQYVSFRKWEVHPFVMSVNTDNCVSFTFTLSLWDIERGNPYGTWEVYCKKPNGEWVLIQTFDVQQNMTTVKVNFEEPMTFTEVAVNRLSETTCKHKYQIEVNEYSLYVE